MTVVTAVILAAVTLFAGIALHEIGHVVGATAMRMSVKEVRIGRGWKLAEVTIGSARLRVDLGRPEGWVRALPGGTTHLRRRLATFALSGPLLGLAFALAMLAVPGTGVRVAAVGLVLINLITLIPVRAQRPLPSGASGTDGYTVLRAITNDEDFGVPFVLAEVLGRAQTDDAGSEPVIRAYVDEAGRGDPTAVMLRALLGEADTQDLDAALAVASRQPARRSCLLLLGLAANGLVWQTLASGEQPSELAVEAIGLAVEAQPENTAERDTFAWALAATGHPGAGLKESNTTLEDDTLSPSDRASCLLVNAICEAGIGKVEAATGRRAEAVALDPQAALLTAADRAIESARTRAGAPAYAALAEPDDSVWELPPSLQPVEMPDAGWGGWIRYRLLPGLGVLLGCILVAALAVIVMTLAWQL